jgi:hypothetical protein
LRDDDVIAQTKEAISHTQAAGFNYFAINKMINQMLILKKIKN